MAATLKGLYSFYRFISSDLADERTKDLPLLDSPFLLIVCLVAYNYFVLRLGPKMMASRQPFNLKKIIIVYDLVQIALNGYIFYKAYVLAWGHKYPQHYLCFPLDWTDTPLNRERTRVVYVYFLVKILDLLDTVFFVLRKKNSHVSFLHLYHHTGMVCLSFSGAKWAPGGHGTFLGFNNSIVHMVMYTYYLAATLRPDSKYTIWWKKYITQLQMLQFLLNTLQQSALLFQPDCYYPRFILFFTIPQNFFMILLFAEFYRKAYMTKKETGEKCREISKED